MKSGRPSKDIVGKIFDSDNYGKFTITQKLEGEYQNGKELYNIKFLDTGNARLSVRKDKILNGCIKDKYAPSTKFHPTACPGYAEQGNLTRDKYLSLLSTWEGMLKRCYDKKSKAFKNYGQKGVFVEDRWLIFENFILDVQELPGWKLKLTQWKKYSLNKEYKPLKTGQYCYSRFTCNWANQREQANSSSNVVLFEAINPKGQKIVTKNLTQFSKDNNLNKNHVCACLNNRRKHHKKWTFKYLE
jgi:hypothetical protein